MKSLAGFLAICLAVALVGRSDDTGNGSGKSGGPSTANSSSGTTETRRPDEKAAKPDEKAAGSAVPPMAKAINRSYVTRCVEEDNINVQFYSKTPSCLIVATHPPYDASKGSCQPDFSNCQPSQNQDYHFTPAVYKLYDDGVTAVEAVREAKWWRARGMQAAVEGGAPRNDIHYLRIARKISGVDSRPQFLVLYMDGYLRLKPQPPVAMNDTCFGSSVIVGPAANVKRPLAEIATAVYSPKSDILQIAYRDGNRAMLKIKSINREHASVVFSLSAATELAFVTFRSMFVESGNAGAENVTWKDASGSSHVEKAINFRGGDGTRWSISRPWSKHNTSAPDIAIIMPKCQQGFASSDPFDY